MCFTETLNMYPLFITFIELLVSMFICMGKMGDNPIVIPTLSLEIGLFKLFSFKEFALINGKTWKQSNCPVEEERL